MLNYHYTKMNALLTKQSEYDNKIPIGTDNKPHYLIQALFNTIISICVRVCVCVPKIWGL